MKLKFLKIIKSNWSEFKGSKKFAINPIFNRINQNTLFPYKTETQEY